MKRKIARCITLFSSAMLLWGCAPKKPQAAITGSIPANQDADALSAALTVTLGSGALPISEQLFGLFLEDINFAVDGGLYAELIKNRSFEYGAMAANGAKHGWQTTSGQVDFQVADGASDGSCLNANNPSYAVLTNTADTPEGIFNTGFLEGLAVTGGQRYTASLFARGNALLTVSLEGKDGTVYAQAQITAQGSGWRKYSVSLTPTESVQKDLRFAVRMDKGTIQLDMVSLMPDDTFAGLPIRKDLGEALQALHPAFLRFPGGCVIEGKSEESMYRWKDSVGGGIPFTVNGQNAVGDPAARPQGIDIWSGTSLHPYYTTYGLGFYEYFLLCEALECMPIPIVNAGMTCPIQSPVYTVYPLDSQQFRQCVQDALDLVEFCRGGPDTAWGAVRIAMGHTAPFSLKYIGIGNEQWQSEYHAHYQAFAEAFEEAARNDPALYGDIELIVANGPASGSTEGWSYVDSHPDGITALVDEHYYEAPSWFLANTHRYDAYDRSRGAKVFLGEYASQSNTMNSALSEAAYMTALERNGDVVALACYAPLFGSAAQNQWLPDMIFFSNHSLYLTPNYYVQKLFAGNAGSAYLPTQVSVTGSVEESSLSGKVGLGSWMTSVAYDNLKVVAANGETLYENAFEEPSRLQDFDSHQGVWAIKDGRLVQSGTGAPADTNTGDVVYVGDAAWSGYTLTVDAQILKGQEGFLIPICVQNSDNNIFWNIGGWGNTVSCLQIVTEGAKSGQITGTVRGLRLKQGRTYHLTVTVSGRSIQCFIDGQLYVDYTQEIADPVYASTVRDESGDVILKVVNITGQAIPVTAAMEGLSTLYGSTARLTVLSAASGGAVNSFQEPDNIVPRQSTLEVADQFLYEAPPYSLTVIRIPAK